VKKSLRTKLFFFFLFKEKNYESSNDWYTVAGSIATKCMQKDFIPRSMIPEAVFREFLAKTLRKLPVSCRNPPGSARNLTQKSVDRIRLPVLTDSCRFRAKPDISVHRNTASMKSPEYHGAGRFLLYVFDLGRFQSLRQKKDFIFSPAEKSLQTINIYLELMILYST